MYHGDAIAPARTSAASPDKITFPALGATRALSEPGAVATGFFSPRARSNITNANAAITNTAVSFTDNAAPRKIAINRAQPQVCSFHQRVSEYTARVTNNANARSIYA